MVGLTSMLMRGQFRYRHASKPRRHIIGYDLMLESRLVGVVLVRSASLLYGFSSQPPPTSRAARAPAAFLPRRRDDCTLGRRRIQTSSSSSLDSPTAPSSSTFTFDAPLPDTSRAAAAAAAAGKPGNPAAGKSDAENRCGVSSHVLRSRGAGAPSPRSARRAPRHVRQLAGASALRDVSCQCPVRWRGSCRLS